MQSVVRRLGARWDQCWFRATRSSAAPDLLVTAGTRRLGFECRRALTSSMRIARDDLKLESLDVVHAGPDTFPMRDGIRALELSRVLDDLEPLAPPAAAPA